MLLRGLRHAVATVRELVSIRCHSRHEQIHRGLSFREQLLPEFRPGWILRPIFFSCPVVSLKKENGTKKIKSDA